MRTAEGLRQTAEKELLEVKEKAMSVASKLEATGGNAASKPASIHACMMCTNIAVWICIYVPGTQCASTVLACIPSTVTAADSHSCTAPP